jgi:hypothetical protein
MPKSKKRADNRAQKIASGVNLVGAAGRAGLALAAGSGKPVLAAAAASFILFPPLIAAYVPALFERQLGRVRKWWAWVIETNADDQPVAEDIERRLQEPGVQDVVFATLREVLEAPAEEAVRPLALLTREYVRTGAKRDRFFRGFARMLGEITGPELDQMKRLLAEVVSEGGDIVQVEIVRKGQARTVGIASLTGDEPRLQRHLAGEFPDIEDVFQLLKRHALGSERTTVSWAMVPTADQLVVERAIAGRLLTYLS